MAQILQACLATGWGGLEMVLCDFQEWLIQNNHNAKVICLKDSPIERNLQKRGLSSHVITVAPGPLAFQRAGRILKKLDSPKTAILFHRQQGPKMLGLVSVKAKTSVLCHTFYDVQKQDFWHHYLFSKVNQWIALTPRHRENLLETSKIEAKKIRIIPNGVDLRRFKPREIKKTISSSKEIHIGLIARLDPQKGQDVALDALKKLNRKNAYLHFFGANTPDANQYHPQIEAQIERLGLKENVIFEGHQEKLEDSIHRMDLIWMPSYRETFGRCIIESMASGVPVIASNAGGVPDIIENEIDGLLFETKNSDQLAEQTRFLIESPELYEKIAAQALIKARSKYDSEKVWSELLRTIVPAEALKMIESSPRASLA